MPITILISELNEVPWSMKSSRLGFRLVFTLLVLLIAIGGVAAGWYASAAYQANAFWQLDPLEHMTLDHTIVLGRYRILVGVSQRQSQHGIIGREKSFSVEIWKAQVNGAHRNWFLQFQPESSYGVPMVVVSGGPMTVPGTSMWVDFGMNGRFGVKFIGSTGLKYYRLDNLWVAARDVREVYTANLPPVIIWHDTRYCFNPQTGYWERAQAPNTSVSVPTHKDGKE